MDLDRITQPLRLARGSHHPGSGKGCAMNVLSYINGDDDVTDFPATSARPLSLMVQSSNDMLAGPDGYLSAENSLLALDLAWLTVGTADVPETIVHAWVAELLTDPNWGMSQYTKTTTQAAIENIAGLHRAAAAAAMVPLADWNSAARAALEVAATLDGAENRAVRAAFESTRFVDGELLTSLDRVVAHAEKAHAMASGSAGAASRIVEFTGQAIRAWRELANLDRAKGAPATVSGSSR
ncbi:MAG: hypothetical protein QOG47_2100 [Mycobacterium sp.]|nr:hypothetical protein [Mycobacterium sp.]